MKNEPKVIYLNCYDKAETNLEYKPQDDDFENLDQEFVTWSRNEVPQFENIKFVHSDIADKDKSIADYILEIDAMTTPEFCDKFGYPRPFYTGNIQTTSTKLLEIDAFKWHKVMEFAKKIRRDK